MTTSAAPAVRLAWPDATRGLGVVAVVLFHVLIWHHDAIGGGPTALSGFWDTTDVAVGRLRMPVLFALSGILAARGLAGGWRSGSARLRAAGNYYIYAVWLTLYLVFFLAAREKGFPHSFRTVRAWATQLFLPDTTLWFILALAIYPVLVTVPRAMHLPAAAVLTVAVASWGAGTYLDMPGFTGKMMANFLFFCVGVYGSAALHAVARSALRSKVGYVVVFLALVGLATVVPQGLVIPVVLLSSLVAVPAAIAVTSEACRIASVARLGAYVGARTLPIYLLHPLVLCGVSFLPGVPAVERLVSTVPGDALYPLGLTVAVIVVSLAIHELLRAIPGNPLFTLPAGLSRNLTTA
ncbi:acyltransferase family protein [Arthrobacter sp. MDB2-24]